MILKKNILVSLYLFKGVFYDVEFNLVFCLFDCLLCNLELLWIVFELFRLKNI